MLVERVINRIINDNIDIDKILIVTFTNAAASEMRERILDSLYKRIDEDPNNINLAKQVTLINKANISTIHSFCLDVIKNNFYEIGISPNFRIGDNSEIELLKQETLEEVFEDFYEENNQEFINLVNIYGGYKDDEALKNLIMDIYNFSISSPFPKDWIHESIEKFNLKDKLRDDFSNTVWGKILIQNFKDEINDEINTLEGLKNEISKEDNSQKYVDLLSSDINILKTIEKRSNTFDEIYEFLQNIKFDMLPRLKYANEDVKGKVKSAREEIKDKIKEFKDKIFSNTSEEENKNIYEMYRVLLSIEKVILKFIEEYQKNKADKNIIDFSDIEHFALDILVRKDEDGKYIPTDIAKKYREKFKEIAIDEYQDSNLVQEYILSTVSNNNNIFMVGDVKQSIYKFRQARPELFLEKYNSYELADIENDSRNCEGNTLIQLFKNFRSRKGILELTNFVFANIMSKDLGDIEYNENEYLNYGLDFEEDQKDEKKEDLFIPELHIINLNNDDNDANEINEEQDNEQDEEQEEEQDEEEVLRNEEIEAKFVANRIKKLVTSGYKICDKDGSLRNVTYKDFVILLRTTSKVASVYETELTTLGIPVFNDASQSYFESEEIEDVMALLKIIDNPNSDIPLVTILRSSIFGFTDNELLKIRLKTKDTSFYNALKNYVVNEDIDIDLNEDNKTNDVLKLKIDNFFEKLNTWQEKQEVLTLDEFIWYLYNETNYYDYVCSMPDGNIKTANLKLLFEKAKDYERASFKGLYNFINYIEKLKKSSRRYNICKNNW